MKPVLCHIWRSGHSHAQKQNNNIRIALYNALVWCDYAVNKNNNNNNNNNNINNMKPLSRGLGNKGISKYKFWISQSFHRYKCLAKKYTKLQSKFMSLKNSLVKVAFLGFNVSLDSYHVMIMLWNHRNEFIVHVMKSSLI